MTFKYTNPYSYPYPNPVYAQPNWYYQPTYTTAQPSTHYQPAAQRTVNVIKVNGIDGANAYPMGPNEEAVFLDANEDYMYYRRTDAGGFGKATWFDFYPHVEEGEPIDVEPQCDYVTRDDFETLAEQVRGLMHPAASKTTTTRTRKAAADGE